MAPPQAVPPTAGLREASAGFLAPGVVDRPPLRLPGLPVARVEARARRVQLRGQLRLDRIPVCLPTPRRNRRRASLREERGVAQGRLRRIVPGAALFAAAPPAKDADRGAPAP